MISKRRRDDTAEIQALLDAGGVIRLDGIYHVERPLRFTKSRTVFIGGHFMCHRLPADRPLFVIAKHTFDCDLRNQQVEGLRGNLFRIDT